jgi:hypothetical protein
VEVLKGRVTKEYKKKIIVTASMDGTRKRESSRNDKTDETEGDLQTLRRIISIWHKMAGDGKDWMGTVLDGMVHNGPECLRSRE